MKTRILFALCCLPLCEKECFMISFWERESFLQHDYIIVGSGITGLSLAAALLEKQPGKRVLVLERGILPTGASTKNAGFACIGSLTELLADLRTMPEREVIDLLLLRLNGLQLLRQRLGDAAIGYQQLGSYELIGEAEMNALDRLAEINQWLRPILGQKPFGRNDDLINKFGFNADAIHAIVVNHLEGQLHTGQMMRALLQYVQRLGALVINGAEVLRFEDTGNGVAVEVAHQALQTKVLFEARHLAICTNAFVQQLLPEAHVQPGRGQVLVTKPIPNLPFKGIFHFDEGYYYFRNQEQRVIFGGGRNLDFQAEATTEFAYNRHILAELQHKLTELILPNTPFEVEMQWTGIMAFGKTKMPTICQLSPNVVAGFKLSGMGVAIGSKLGQMLANMMEE